MENRLNEPPLRLPNSSSIQHSSDSQGASGVDTSRLIVLEGAAHDAIETALEAFGSGARESLRLEFDVDFHRAGPWAGIKDWLHELLPHLQAENPELLKHHGSEVAYVLPELKKSLGVKYQTLTDLAPPEEKVRNYPADRSYRVVNGLIELLEANYQGKLQGRDLVLICHNFHRLSHIGQRFFRTLLRRRGDQLNLRIVALLPPGHESPLKGDDIHLVPVTTSPPLDSPAQPLESPPSPAEAKAKTESLIDLVKRDPDAAEIHIAEMLYLFRLLGNEKGIFFSLCRALEIYNNLGFYEDALEYGHQAWELFDIHGEGNKDLHWVLLVKLFTSSIGLQQGEKAYEMVKGSGILEDEDLDRPRRAQLYYLLSMLHVRFFKVKDLVRGEEYLEKGLEDLEASRAEMKEHEYHFYSVFNRNGLALIRHFQGRYEEAIELCRSGFEQLETHLGGDQHKLHRSVLLYNIGQVQSAMGDNEEAIDYFSKAMEMDPNYSEYHNERGSLYLRQGRYEEAIADYHRAIELSPPYVEVWTNLGQCYRQVGQLEAAIQAYSRGLDLDPNNLLAAVGRGQAFEGVEQLDLARSDYDHALALDPEQWDTLGSRAVVLYQLGELELSLQDLDRAIELNPEHAELYFNRSVARQDLGRTAEAIDDLRAYLQLSPAEAEDRGEVEERIQTLLAA